MKKEGMEYYLKSQAGIPLVLDSYEDLFSDFDPRPYSKKALSGDFLLECKKASAEKRGKIRIRFFLPKNKRDPLEEIKIKKRLKEHFSKHFIEKKKEIIKIKAEGIFWFFMGVVMMALSFFLSNQGELASKFLIFTEPAGWFLFWEGLDKFLITSKDKKPDYSFYKKMVGAEISFANC